MIKLDKAEIEKVLREYLTKEYNINENDEIHIVKSRGYISSVEIYKNEKRKKFNPNN